MRLVRLYAQDIHLKPSSPTRLHKQSMHRRSRVESYCCHTVHDSFSSKSSQLMSSGLSNVIAINTPHFMFQLWPSGTDSPYMTLPQSDPPTTCANSPEKNAVRLPESFKHSGPPPGCNRPLERLETIWACIKSTRNLHRMPYDALSLTQYQWATFLPSNGTGRNIIHEWFLAIHKSHKGQAAEYLAKKLLPHGFKLGSFTGPPRLVSLLSRIRTHFSTALLFPVVRIVSTWDPHRIVLRTIALSQVFLRHHTIYFPYTFTLSKDSAYSAF
jgi:hypothetical protein